MPENKKSFESSLSPISTLKSDSLKNRLEFVQLHAQSNNIASIKALIDALNDESWTIRKVAAESLGEKGEEAIPFLNISLNSGIWYVKAAVCRALGIIGMPSSVYLIYPYISDINITLKEEAENAIYNIISKDVQNFVEKYLSQVDPSFWEHFLEWLEKNYEDLYEEINSYLED